jgi:hypothetical protein
VHHKTLFAKTWVTYKRGSMKTRNLLTKWPPKWKCNSKKSRWKFDIRWIEVPFSIDFLLCYFEEQDVPARALSANDMCNWPKSSTITWAKSFLNWNTGIRNYYGWRGAAAKKWSPVIGCFLPLTILYNRNTPLRNTFLQDIQDEVVETATLTCAKLL